MTRTIADIAAMSARNRKAWSGDYEVAKVSVTGVVGKFHDRSPARKTGPKPKAKREPAIASVPREMRFELPFPPTLNNLFVNAPGRGRVPSKSAKEYRTKVITAVGVVSPLVGALKSIVYLYPPTKRKLDIDNFAKAIFDGLGHAGVYQDDSQIDVLTILRMPVVSGGKAIVYLKQI